MALLDFLKEIANTQYRAMQNGSRARGFFLLPYGRAVHALRVYNARHNLPRKLFICSKQAKR